MSQNQLGELIFKSNTIKHQDISNILLNINNPIFGPVK